MALIPIMQPAPNGMSEYTPLQEYLIYQKFNGSRISDFFTVHISPLKYGEISLIKPSYFNSKSVSDCSIPTSNDANVVAKRFNKRQVGVRQTLCYDKFKQTNLGSFLTVGTSKVDFYDETSSLVDILVESTTDAWGYDLTGQVFFGNPSYTNSNPQKQAYGSAISGIFHKIKSDTTIPKVVLGQLNDTTNTAVNVMEKMLDIAPSELLSLGKENLVFHVSDKFARNYRRNLRAQYPGVQLAWLSLQDGNISEKFDGIDIRVYPIWDDVISYLELEVTTPPYELNALAILAPKPELGNRSNLHILMNNVGDDENFRIYPPDRHSKDWAVEFMADVDTLFGFSEFLTVAY